ncbi:hypothetical protein EDB81DRAFT_896753, partial [Dactylonectria macrodidyma]
QLPAPFSFSPRVRNLSLPHPSNDQHFPLQPVLSPISSFSNHLFAYCTGMANLPPPPDHPGAAMYQFTHGPGLHDIQPQREGFWTLAGHDAELFRLGFVHTPPGQATAQLLYQVFRPIKSLDVLETHASDLIYEYEGGKHDFHSNLQLDETKLRHETDFASIPQHDEGFAAQPTVRDDLVHISHSDLAEEGVMNQGQNIVQDDLQVEQGSVIQSDNSLISQMMSEPDAQVLSPLLDDNLLAASQSMDDGNWAFPPDVFQSQDYNLLNGTPEMNVEDLGMNQEQMVASGMPHTQEWAELPDADNDQLQGDDQMILPDF